MLCQCCLDKDQQLFNLPCQHGLCADCWNMLIADKTKNKDVYLVCPFCDSEFRINQLSPVLKKTVFENFNCMLISKGEFQLADKNEIQIKCVNHECEFGFIVHKKMKEINCAKCKSSLCTMCQQYSHGRLSCEEAMQSQCYEFLQFANQMGYTQCPKCRIIIERRDGCNFMTCRSQSCKGLVFFCFKCRKRLTMQESSTHYKNNDSFKGDCVGVEIQLTPEEMAYNQQRATRERNQKIFLQQQALLKKLLIKEHLKKNYERDYQKFKLQGQMKAAQIRSYEPVYKLDYTYQSIETNKPQQIQIGSKHSLSKNRY